jgi:hypothetical protein
MATSVVLKPGDIGPERRSRRVRKRLVIGVAIAVLVVVAGGLIYYQVNSEGHIQIDAAYWTYASPSPNVSEPRLGVLVVSPNGCTNCPLSVVGGSTFTLLVEVHNNNSTSGASFMGAYLQVAFPFTYQSSTMPIPISIPPGGNVTLSLNILAAREPNGVIAQSSVEGTLYFS